MRVYEKGKLMCALCRKYFPKKEIKSHGYQQGKVCLKCLEKYKNNREIRI